MYEAGRLRRVFKEKKVVLGTHIRSQDPCITEMLAGLGFDVVWIENEHSNLDKYQTTLHIMAAQAEGAAAVVRLPWNDPVLAKPILELGVDGVVFPMIRSAEEAKAAVAACTYPPKGIRGMGPIRSDRYGTVPKSEYIANADRHIFKIMQIEHIDGVRDIENILNVEGVDGIVVGQYDLSGSMGMLGDIYHPEILGHIHRVFRTCQSSGVVCGISSEPKKEVVQRYLEMGADFIFMCYEYDWIRLAAGEALEQMNRLIGGKETER